MNSSQENATAPKNTVNQPRTILGNSNSTRTGAGGFTKMNGGGTVVLKPTAKNRTVSTIHDNNSGSILSNASDGAPGGHLRNVVGFRDLNDSGTSNLSLFSLEIKSFNRFRFKKVLQVLFKDQHLAAEVMYLEHHRALRHPAPIQQKIFVMFGPINLMTRRTTKLQLQLHQAKHLHLHRPKPIVRQIKIK